MPKRRAQDDVGRLAADARQGGQGVEVAGDFAAVVARRAAAAIASRFFALARKKPVEWIRASTLGQLGLGERSRRRDTGRRGRA